MFNCRFQDGTLVTNLTYAENLKMFDEAFPTDNPAIFLKINHIKHLMTKRSPFDFVKSANEKNEYLGDDLAGYVPFLMTCICHT